MKNFSCVIGCFVILVALASCGTRDSQVDSSEVIPSLEVSSFREELTSIDIVDMSLEEAHYTKKTADSEDEFAQILETIDNLEFVSSDNFESGDSVNIKMIFNLQNETKKVLEYEDGLVSFDGKEHYCNSGNGLVRLYDMLDGEEIDVDEYGKEIVDGEDETDEEDPSIEKSKEQGSEASQSGANQQSSAGQQSKTTQQSSDKNNPDIEAAEKPDNGVSSRSVENEHAHAEEAQETETLPPLGSAENPYAVEPQGKVTMQEDEDYKWEYKGEELQDSPPMEPQNSEALPPLGSAENPYAEEPTAEPSPPDDLAEGLSKDPELPDIPPMEPKMKSR